MVEEEDQVCIQAAKIYHLLIFSPAFTSGGMDIHSIEDNLQCSSVIKFRKCLSSKDKWFSDVAWDQLWSTVTKRSGYAPEGIGDIMSFINSSLLGVKVERMTLPLSGPRCASR